MPTYVYECPKCKGRLELVQSISNRINPICSGEKCGGNIEMESVIFPPQFILKGDCWAKDGYGRKK